MGREAAQPQRDGARHQRRPASPGKPGVTRTDVKEMIYLTMLIL